MFTMSCLKFEVRYSENVCKKLNCGLKTLPIVDSSNLKQFLRYLMRVSYIIAYIIHFLCPQALPRLCHMSILK